MAEISLAMSLLICVAFIVLSTWCTLYSKYIFEYVFPSSNCLLLVQNSLTASLLLLAQAVHLIDGCSLRSLGLLDWACGFSYSINVMTGLWSLVFVNIAMFGALKRCTVVASWIIEAVFTPMSTTTASLPAVVLLLTSTIGASFYDLKFSAWGYGLSGISCIAQAAAFELGRRVAAGKGVPVVLLCNSVVGVVMQTIVVSVTGEWKYLAPSTLTWPTLGHFILNSFSVLLMNGCIFLNCFVNSPLAHAVTGNCKAIFTTIIGTLIFDVPLLPLGWVGVVGNFVGAAWFSVLKLRARHGRKDLTPHRNGGSNGSP